MDPLNNVFQSPAKRPRSEAVDNEKLRRKLRAAVATALEEHGVDLKHPLFNNCGKKLFAICKTYAVVSTLSGRAFSSNCGAQPSEIKYVFEFGL